MRTKQEYYDLVLKNRELAKDPEALKCTYTQTLCEWHGRCRECVALHRYHKDHVPACFQSFINDKLKEVVKIGELTAIEMKRHLSNIGCMLKNKIKRYPLIQNKWR